MTEDPLLIAIKDFEDEGLRYVSSAVLVGDRQKRNELAEPGHDLLNATLGELDEVADPIQKLRVALDEHQEPVVEAKVAFDGLL